MSCSDLERAWKDSLNSANCSLGILEEQPQSQPFSKKSIAFSYSLEPLYLLLSYTLIPIYIILCSLCKFFKIEKMDCKGNHFSLHQI